MTAWHVRAVRLPEGDAPEDSWLTRSGWQSEPVRGAEDLPGRFSLPGLVDAHSHVSFAEGPDGPVPVNAEGAAANVRRHAESGVALLRDAGGLPAVVLALPALAGQPHLVPAGRHLAPPGMYFEAVHDPVEAPDLVDVALRELAAGARWVKLVADFPPAAARAVSGSAPPEQTYELDVVRALVEATHLAGGRVAAHVTTATAVDLVRLGVDSIEHGTALDEEAIAEMAQRGTAWVPTLCAVLSVADDAPSERRRRAGQRWELMRALLPVAVAMGVPVLTGTDVVGTIPREVALLVECGLSPREALRAATSTAVAFLGADATNAPPAVVTFAADPREHPGVLAHPEAIVIGRRRVR